MLTMVKVKNKNTRTMTCCIDFNFEHMQVNLFFLLLNLNMYLSVKHGIKSTKQLKCTVNDMTVSLKHVHVT